MHFVCGSVGRGAGDRDWSVLFCGGEKLENDEFVAFNNWRKWIMEPGNRSTVPLLKIENAGDRACLYLFQFLTFCFGFNLPCVATKIFKSLSTVFFFLLDFSP